MRFARGDVRAHIISRKNDHGPAYRRDGPLQRRKFTKINFREILGIVRFSSFATQSGVNRKSASASLTSEFDPERTSKLGICLI